MDIKWKDENGNILNADNKNIKYLDADSNIQTNLKIEEVKKIIIEGRLMHIFKDFENDLELTIVIPKKNKRDAVKIFNDYDKTGKLLKRNSGSFWIDLILESSVITYNPFTGVLVILTIILFLFASLFTLPMFLLGEDAGPVVSKILIATAIIYPVLSHVMLRIKRKKLKEINY